MVEVWLINVIVDFIAQVDTFGFQHLHVLGHVGGIPPEVQDQALLTIVNDIPTEQALPLSFALPQLVELTSEVREVPRSPSTCLRRRHPVEVPFLERDLGKGRLPARVVPTRGFLQSGSMRCLLLPRVAMRLNAAMQRCRSSLSGWTLKEGPVDSGHPLQETVPHATLQKDLAPGVR